MAHDHGHMPQIRWGRTARTACMTAVQVDVTEKVRVRIIEGESLYSAPRMRHETGSAKRRQTQFVEA